MVDHDLAASRKFAARLFRFAGFTQKEIAQKIGVTVSSVDSYCRGFEKGKRIKLKADRPVAAYARKLKHEGMSYAQIASIIGVSAAYIANLLYVKRNRSDEPKKCCDCGKSGERLHYHHTNYAKDEFVILCVSCHMKRHWKEDREKMLRRLTRSGSKISGTEK